MYIHIFISFINLLYGGHILIAVLYYTEMYKLRKYSLMMMTMTTKVLNIVPVCKKFKIEKQNQSYVFM